MICGKQEKHLGGYGMNRRVLVTGGNGFIGSKVLKKLLENGDTPIIIKRNSSDMWRIETILNQIILYNIDKLSLDKVFETEKIDAVINLATYYKKNNTFQDIEKLVETNVKFPSQILQLCSDHEVPIFVTAGSYFQYATNYISSTVTNSSIPRDLYAATKSALTKIMEYYSSRFNTRTVELTLFTPYGEMDHEEKLVPYLIKQALQKSTVYLSSGFQKLNMVYVEDVAAAFVKSLDLVEKKTFTHHRIDVANTKSYSIRDIVTVIEDIIQSNLIVKWNSVNINETDQDDEIMINNSEIEKIMNWKPKFDLYEGLRKTIDYYKGEIVGN